VSLKQVGIERQRNQKSLPCLIPAAEVLKAEGRIQGCARTEGFVFRPALIGIESFLKPPLRKQKISRMKQRRQVLGETRNG
jgi:hypothetical protein